MEEQKKKREAKMHPHMLCAAERHCGYKQPQHVWAKMIQGTGLGYTLFGLFA